MPEDPDCAHDELRQHSTLTAETIWIRGEDGFHAPEDEINTILAEETLWFECLGCGSSVDPSTAP